MYYHNIKNAKSNQYIKNGDTEPFTNEIESHKTIYSDSTSTTKLLKV